MKNMLSRTLALTGTAGGVRVRVGHVRALGQAPIVTAFEGARVIVGDGRAHRERDLVVNGTRIVRRSGSPVDVPAGARHVNLAGKTVMPDIIDTHTHLSQSREEVTKDLKRRAYWGVSAANSMGTDRPMA